MTFLRPVIARLAAALIGALVAWLAARGFDVPAETQTQLIEATVGLMLAVFGIVYAVVHRLISARTNPADAASPRAARVMKRELAQTPAGWELGDETGG